MSHDLYSRNGRTSMFYAGNPPWHRLGQRLDQPGNAAEAISEAGLDFTVQKRPLKAVLKGRQTTVVESHFATVRMDTGDVLGVVGRRYVPIQNRAAFTFFDPLIERDESVYHTAGVIGKGEKTWILAKLPDYIRIGRKKDPVEKYVLLYNSHDGSSHIRIKLTPIRVVCNNTLSVALNGADDEVRIRHTESAPGRLEEAHKLLGLTNQLYRELDETFNAMALRRITDRELLAYVKTLIPSNPEAERTTRTDNIRKRILEVHESVADARIHRGTVFGAYNAVTEMVDHDSPAKDPSKQLRSIWFGGGEKLKQRAFSLAKTLL